LSTINIHFLRRVQSPIQCAYLSAFAYVTTPLYQYPGQFSRWKPRWKKSSKFKPRWKNTHLG